MASDDFLARPRTTSDRSRRISFRFALSMRHRSSAISFLHARKSSPSDSTGMSASKRLSLPRPHPAGGASRSSMWRSNVSAGAPAQQSSNDAP